LRDDITARLGETLPSYMLPARLHVIAAVPKLPGGKVDPAALQRLDDASIRRGGHIVRGPLARLRHLLGIGSG
jgi:hypothetical protein